MASSLLFLLLLSLFTPTLAKNVSFDSASFSFSNLTLLGDSYLRNGTIGLTKETGVPSSSAGSVILNQPIQFFDPLTNTSASFSTKFSFSITNQNPGSFGDGLTFFISPSNSSLGATGGFLGVFNSNNSTDNGTLIAIEFDTLLNEEFNDTTDNHVGLDIGAPLSIKAVDLGSYGIDLKSGNSTTAWIDYSNKDNQLSIWLAYTNVKPDNPIFSINIDLSKNFADFMYVGFSASTEGSTELHMIRDWTFQTFGFPSINLSSSATPNSTNGSLGIIPNITINSSNVTSRKRLTLALGILGPLALCLGFVLFMWVTIKKIIEFTTKKEGFASEALKGPRKFTYKELSAATRGFHMTRIIGKGAFGTVFKAVMPGTGDTYAVKRAKHEHQFNLVDWVWKLYSENRLIEAADKRLHGEFDEEGMVRLLLVGLSCANPNCVERPSMRKVFQILSGEADPIPVPKKKPLLVFCSSASLSMKEIVSDGEDTPPGLSPLTQIKID
ncbi:putative L-type lectin-domain containing receptor kinase S.7 [Carex littledalei]|uniref:Putative L-type lectin-domain containing receptor kinase S.7 n=1 Tax=Carex littledalei TaxID=544730 RepID=A0A833R7U3_9POAL|nr:putative L-type lectin-domain containing receptor kinase S.7 [Carex littledalei]